MPRTKIAFDWVTIPAGEFTMGSNERDDRNPIRKVYLREYQMARYPLTNEQWAIFLRESGYSWKSYLWKNGLPRGKEKHPVVGVSWYDATAFCKWAGVRLPTEEEWEKAARGIDGRKYPWGNQEPTTDYCCLNVNELRTPVGIYPKGASPYGILDMISYGWEWTSTVDVDNKLDLERYIMRGGYGCYNSRLHFFACTFRSGSLPDGPLNSPDSRFRCVR